MPSPATSSAVRDSVVAAAVFAALTLPDPARLRPGARHLLRLGSAAMSGWAGWRAARSSEVHLVPPAAFGAAAGAAAALALAPVEDATDRWLDSSLRRAGVGRPRPVMALAAAGLGAFAWLSDRPSGSDREMVEVGDLYTERELDPALKELVHALLAAGPSGSAAVLAAQLDQARSEALGEDFESTVMLRVDDAAARVVPHTQAWPVRARWHIDGHPVELTLQVHAGRLDHVALTPVEEDYPAEVDPFEVTPVDDPDNTWPPVHAVTLVEETPEGVRPVAAGHPS